MHPTEMLKEGLKPCTRGDLHPSCPGRGTQHKSSNRCKTVEFYWQPHLLVARASLQDGPRDTDRGMSCVDTQLPPARLQTQGVRAGERDVEQTERGKRAEGQKQAEASSSWPHVLTEAARVVL